MKCRITGCNMEMSIDEIVPHLREKHKKEWESSELYTEARERWIFQSIGIRTPKAAKTKSAAKQSA